MAKLETERLTLRLYEESDKEKFVRLVTDADVMKHVDKGVLADDRAGALWTRLTGEFYPKGINTIWAVDAKDDARYIGNASIRPRPGKNDDWEIGYYLRKEEWGNGFASEVARRLVQYGFEELNLREVFATVDSDNLASIRVLEKAGLDLHREEHDADGMFYVFRAGRAEHPQSISAVQPR